MRAKVRLGDREKRVVGIDGNLFKGHELGRLIVWEMAASMRCENVNRVSFRALVKRAGNLELEFAAPWVRDKNPSDAAPQTQDCKRQDARLEFSAYQSQIHDLKDSRSGETGSP
jgi:hypothetical protein